METGEGKVAWTPQSTLQDLKGLQGSRRGAIRPEL